VLRGAVPRLFPADEPLKIGQPRLLGEGDDLTIISSGAGTEEALRVVGPLRESGVSLTHLHVSTLKPFAAEERLLAALRRPRSGVITIENHTVIGGLGSAVAEHMAELGAGVPLLRLGLQDTFAHGASRAYLLRQFEMDALALLRAAERLLGRELGIDEDALPRTPEPVASREAKAEDL